MKKLYKKWKVKLKILEFKKTDFILIVAKNTSMGKAKRDISNSIRLDLLWCGTAYTKHLKYLETVKDIQCSYLSTRNKEILTSRINKYFYVKSLYRMQLSFCLK